MTAVFLHFLNMSITAGWIVLAVLLLRLCLKRAPRWITCLLWGLVALRLVLPFSIESALSLIPSAQTVPSDIVSTDTPSIDSGVTIIDRPVNGLLQTVVPSQPVTPPADIPDAPPVEPSVPLMERITQVAAWVWVGGIALMLVYELVSVWRLRRRVFDAIRLRDNLWQTDRIDSPFILGVFRPRIYLPYGLDEDTTAQVLAHEQSHLRRRDHWVKPFAFTLLAVYWFNPLLWVAYILLCRDIEIACDERVIRNLSATERQQYATALLNCGVERRSIAACPLAFGEVGLKQRIRTALHYRKPLLWVIIVSLLVCSVAAVCLLTVPGERAIEVLNSQEVEPDQSRNYCSTDTDGSITDSGLAWLWEHAENRKDRKDATSMPLTIVDSLDELNELVEALNAPQRADIGYWMNFEKYDDTYFEENTLVWVFIPGDDNGRYEYTVSLEETNKGLRYAAYLTRLATSTFYGGAPSRCQNLLLFEVDRDTVKQTDRFMTRYEWTDVDTPSEEDGHYMSVGSADVDGDGEPEDISLFIESSTDNYLSYSIVVRRADGTPLLNEVYDGYGSFQCYLVPQEDGPARLLLISGHMGNESDCERYCVLSLEDGVRTMIDYSWDGQLFSGYALRLDLMAFYVQSLSGWLEDAQLVFESAMGEVYHGDTIGSATYEPLSWLDAYQQSEDDTLQDTMENILADYAVETTPVGEIDFDGDGRQETLSAVSYWSGSTDRYCLVVRDAEEKVVTCFDVYSYLTSIDDYENSENVYVYKITDSAGRESLVRLEVQKDGDCLIYDLTESGSHYSHSMPQEEWRSSLQGKTCEALFHIWNRELTLIDTQAITYRPSFFSATYRLEIEVETDSFGMERVRSLSLWNKRRTKCVQTFSFADFGYDEYDYTVVTDQPVYVQDVTFDGREELLIPVAYSARYQDFGVFLWDKKNKQLDWLTTTLRNPAVDEKHKVIRTCTSGDGISSYSAWAYNADTQDFACTHSLYFEENSGATGDGDAMRLVVTEEGKTTELFVPGERYELDKTDPQVAPYYEDGSFWDLDSERWGEVFYRLAEKKSEGSDKLNPDYPVLLEKGENYHLYATEDQLEYWYCVWDDSGEVLDSGTKDYRGATDFSVEDGLLILTHSGGGSSVQPSKRYYDVSGQYASGANRVSEDFGPVVAHKEDRVAYFDEDDSGQIVLRVKNLFDRSEQPVEIHRDYSTMVFRTACSGSFSTNGKAFTFTYYSSPDDDAVTETVIINGEQRSYLSPDPTKDAAYNNAIAVYNDFLSGQISAVDKTGETLSLHVTDIVSDIYTGKKGPSRYALADLTGDGVPELLTESYYWTLDIFSVQAGELVRMFYKSPSSTWKVLSNGAVWADKTSAGSMYTYTVFDRSGTAQSVSFGDPGEGSSLSCYFEDEDVTREQYEALTAEYFYQSESEALMLWYDYDERLPESKGTNRYVSLLSSEYSDGDAWYALYDMDRDGTEELIVQKWPKLYVYALDEGESKLLVEDEFVGGTSRFLLTLDRDYPGFVYFTVGGGKDRYYYLSLDKVEDNKFVRTPLWTDNYGEYQEGEPGRITELTENKQLIELSRKAYQNDWDVIFTSLNGEREPDRSHVAVPEAYTAVLQDYKTLLDYRFSEDFYEENNSRFWDELNSKLQLEYFGKDILGDFGYMFIEMDEAKDCDSPDDYGYVLKDINDDGVQELFWVGKCHTILAVFTIMNGQAELLDAFWPRYTARMTEDGYLYTQSSGGAAYTQFDIYKLLPNSSVLERRIGFAQDGEDVYLEWVEDKQVTITQERFEKLQQQHPFEHSVEWLCLPIIAL